MAARNLNKFRKLRLWVLALRRRALQWRTGARIGERTRVSTSASLIGGKAGAIEIGAETLVGLKSLIIARDPWGVVRPVSIGNRCFIGASAVISPGVTVGDEVIVGGGSVVLHDIPARCAVGGNPARILHREIDVGPFGRLSYADANQKKATI